MKPILSICIPTFNRQNYLLTCLDSIKKSLGEYLNYVEICISDNCSTDDTSSVVKNKSTELNIKYSVNSKNLWGSANLVKVVSMAQGDYVWVIGDDDLLLPNAIKEIIELINRTKLDFYFINAYSVSTQVFFDPIKKFNITEIPNNTITFSKIKRSYECDFLDLISPKISFDFLGALYLSIFNRKKWVENVNILDYQELIDRDRFEIFETTFPQIKVYAKAFSGSRAYHFHRPLLISLSGTQDWASFWPLIKSVRMVEALNLYRKEGMETWRYFKNMNYAHRTFASDYIKMLMNPNETGGKYANLKKSLLIALFFPNFYFSIFFGAKNLILSKLNSSITYLNLGKD